MMNTLKNISLLIVTMVVCFVILELSLRIFTPFPINVTSNKKIHEKLLYVVNPEFPEIDKLGFRNEIDIGKARIFAIGDSHTYGNNVVSKNAWPKQLSEMIGESVYNFGVGSYNIYQYYQLVEISSELRPKNVLVGFLPANDITLNVCAVTALHYWKVKEKLFGINHSHCAKDTGENDFIVAAGTANNDHEDTLISKIKKYLKFRSALFNSVDHLIWDPLQAKLGDGLEWRDATYRDDTETVDLLTIDTGDMQITANANRIRANIGFMDLKREDVAENLLNAKILFLKMQEVADRKNFGFGVFIIPSKERVIATWAESEGIPVPDLVKKASEIEDILVGELLEHFHENSIKATDATERMVDLFSKNMKNGRMTYPPTDSHPWQDGYAEYAKTAIELLKD